MTTPLTAVDTAYLDKLIDELEDNIDDRLYRALERKSVDYRRKFKDGLATYIKAIGEKVIGEDIAELNDFDYVVNKVHMSQRLRLIQLLSTPAPEDGSADPEAPERLKDYMENKSNE